MLPSTLVAVMEAVPWAAPAVTTPVEGLTEITEGAELLQTTAGLSALRFCFWIGGAVFVLGLRVFGDIRNKRERMKNKSTHLAGKTVAVSCRVCVGFTIVVTGVLIVTLATLTTPVGVVVTVLPSASVAVMTEAPLPTAVRRPVESTVTFVGSELTQETTVDGGYSVMVSCTGPPRVVTVGLTGEMVREPTEKKMEERRERERE